jgi:hypothetical protein
VAQVDPTFDISKLQRIFACQPRVRLDDSVKEMVRCYVDAGGLD